MVGEPRQMGALGDAGRVAVVRERNAFRLRFCWAVSTTDDTLRLHIGPFSWFELRKRAGKWVLWVCGDTNKRSRAGKLLCEFDGNRDAAVKAASEHVELVVTSSPARMVVTRVCHDRGVIELERDGGW